MGWGSSRRSEKDYTDEDDLHDSDFVDEERERGRRRSSASSDSKRKKMKAANKPGLMENMFGSLFGWGQANNSSSASSSSKSRRDSTKKSRRQESGWCKSQKSSYRWGIICFSVVVTVYVFDFISILREGSSKREPAFQGSSSDVGTGGAGNEIPEAHGQVSRNDQTDGDIHNKTSMEADNSQRSASLSRSEGGNIDEGGGSHAQDNRVLSEASLRAASEPGAGSQHQQSEKDEGRQLGDDVQVKGNTGRLNMEEVKSYYRKLAKSYLSTFRNGIHRNMFFDVLRRRTYAMTPPGANKGTQSMLFQIIDGRVHVMDPYDVPRNSKPFYRTRINEIIWLLSKLARAGRIKNTEFLVSIHDCVQTVNKPHTYRGATHMESVPAFTIVSCNFSDNIPFPMWEGEAERGGGFEGWDESMRDFSSNKQPWSEKEGLAVFRGGNRPSMFFQNKTGAGTACDRVGRTRLVHLASKHPSFLDVSVGGTCGGVHTLLNRMNEIAQQKYKYIVYAEGNCFWADRINKQIFGPSLVVKQETPCGQFWEPLLAPLTHYLPTDFFFDNLIDQLQWARDNDEKAQEMVRNANEFAHNFLSLAGIEAYAEVLLEEYSALLVEPDIKLENGAMDVTDKRV